MLLSILLLLCCTPYYYCCAALYCVQDRLYHEQLFLHVVIVTVFAIAMSEQSVFIAALPCSGLLYYYHEQLFLHVSLSSCCYCSLCSSLFSTMYYRYSLLRRGMVMFYVLLCWGKYPLSLHPPPSWLEQNQGLLFSIMYTTDVNTKLAVVLPMYLYYNEEHNKTTHHIRTEEKQLTQAILT